MSENGPVIPRSFWIIRTLALVWNIIGIANYVMQVTMTAEMLMALPAGKQAVLIWYARESKKKGWLR